MCAGGLPRNIGQIRELAKKQAATITMGQLMRWRSSDPQQLIRLGRWLHEHIPIRYARRLDEFLQLPYAVVQNAKFKEVLNKYLDTLDAVSAFPKIRTRQDEAAFCDLMSDQLQHHRSVAVLVSEGYAEIRHMYPNVKLDDFLDNLFATRISTRILVDNYIDMRKPRLLHTGIVQKDLQPLRIIQELAEALTDLTYDIYQCCPEIIYQGNLSCTVDYIPGHVAIVVREVLKNALRATVERHLARQASSKQPAVWKEPPPVVVELQKGDVNVIIKISDQGGGMPKRLQKEAWQYGWTTVLEEDDQNITLDPATWPAQAGVASSRRKDLAGYGFGLPLTRLYAQYFGGEVFMQALPGHGTDMYLLLNHLREGAPSTEMDDPSTALTVNENRVNSIDHAP